jgi:hypothetical protein
VVSKKEIVKQPVGKPFQGLPQVSRNASASDGNDTGDADPLEDSASTTRSFPETHSGASSHNGGNKVLDGAHISDELDDSDEELGGTATMSTTLSATAMAPTDSVLGMGIIGVSAKVAGKAAKPQKSVKTAVTGPVAAVPIKVFTLDI